MRLADLNVQDKETLVQCAVFQGSFTPEAVEHVLVLDRDDSAQWPLDLVAKLIRHGLIESFQPLPYHTRFTLSADALAIAALARTELSTAFLHQVQSRHAAYYARLGSYRRIEALSQHQGGHHVQILMLEQANLRAGLDHALEHQQARSAAGLLLGYSALVNLKGPPHLLSRYCERVLESEAIDGILKVRVLIEYAKSLRISVGISEAHAVASQALELAGQLDEPHYQALALGVLGIVAIQAGSTQLSLELSFKALAIHRESKNRMYEGILLADMGIIYTTLGDLTKARACHEEALLIHREVGNRRCEGVAMTNLALINTELGDEGIATELYEEAIVLLRETAHKRLEGCALGNLGDLYLNQDKLKEAREYLETAVEISSEVGYKVPEGAFLGSLSELHRRENDFEESRRCIERAEVLMRQANDAIELAKVICRKGWLDLAQNDLAASERALAEAQQLTTNLGMKDDNSLAISITKLANQIGKAKRRIGPTPPTNQSANAAG